MKNALAPSASRCLSGETAAILPLIFIRAETSDSWVPGDRALPRSAANSRYRESVRIRAGQNPQTTIATIPAMIQGLPLSRRSPSEGRSRSA